MAKFFNFYYVMSMITLMLGTTQAKPTNVNKNNEKSISASNEDNFYMIFVDNTYNNSNSTNSNEKRQENNPVMDSMINELHNLIMENKDTYKDQEKFEEIEIQDSILKKRDSESEVHYLLDYGDSSYVYPVATVNNKSIINAYLSPKLVKLVRAKPNVISATIPFEYEFAGADSKSYYNETDILSQTKWKSLKVRESSELHLSLLSQGKYDNKLIGWYDENYYYPESAGEDVDIFIFDTGFNFRSDEFSNQDERITKCLFSITDGKIESVEHEDYCYGSYKEEGRDLDNHGSIVADMAGGLKYGVAPKANIYAILMNDLKSNSIIAGLKYIRDSNYFRPGKAIFNFSYRGFRTFENLEEEEITTYEEIVDEMSKKGAVFFASAGNDNQNTYNKKENKVVIPCNFKNEICVGGLGNKSVCKSCNVYLKDPDSNYGKNVDIYAPYNMIVKYKNKNMKEDAHFTIGTSFSSPIAAGVAATIMSENPNVFFNTKTMKLYLTKLGQKNVISDLPEDNPNVLINNGKKIVYSSDGKYKGCGINAGNIKCSNGECCSVDGQCTTDSNSCKTINGCQIEFGFCEVVTTSDKDKRCGLGFGSCPKGYCCSAQGYCGKTDGHCGFACQKNYGLCK